MIATLARFVRERLPLLLLISALVVSGALASTAVPADSHPNAVVTPGPKKPKRPTKKRRHRVRPVHHKRQNGDPPLAPPVVVPPPPPLPPPPPPPPLLAEQTPANGSADGRIDAPVRVRFTVPVDAASVTPQTLIVRDAAGVPVPAAVSYDAATFAVTATPAAALVPDAAYSAAVSGVRSATGSSLPAATWPFRTAPVLLAAGDVAGRAKVEPNPTYCTGNAGAKDTGKLLDTLAGQIAMLGDTTYPVGAKIEFDQCFDPAWGRHKPRLHPVIGNHEYQTPQAAPYFDYFGASAGPRGDAWYSFDMGSWHIVVLNANCGVVGCGPGSRQEQWLRNDLIAHPSRCSIAMWHQPRVASGEYGQNDEVATLFSDFFQAGGDIVLNGHEHTYERIVPMNAKLGADPANGVRTFVVGTGGIPLLPIKVSVPQTELYDNSSLGVLRLVLLSNGYEWSFRPTPGGTNHDSGSSTCHDAPRS